MKKKFFLSIFFFNFLAHAVPVPRSSFIFRQRIAAQRVTRWALTTLQKGVGQNYTDAQGVTQLEHSLQTAENLIDYHGGEIDFTNHQKAEVIYAGLLHNICNMLAEKSMRKVGPFVVEHGANISAFRLHNRGFSARMCQLIRNSEQAQIYLAQVRPDYVKELSEEGQKILLERQFWKGPLKFGQFNKKPSYPTILKLRYADDAAHVPGKETRPLEWFEPYLEKYLTHQFTTFPGKLESTQVQLLMKNIDHL